MGRAAKVQRFFESAMTDFTEQLRHIWLQGSQTEPGGRYITPLCPECNAKRGQKIPVKKGSVIFKELGARVIDKQ